MIVFGAEGRIWHCYSRKVSPEHSDLPWGDGVRTAKMWLQMLLHLLNFWGLSLEQTSKQGKLTNSELIASGTKVAGCLATS